jgi:ribose 5-phosphate isomerase A
LIKGGGGALLREKILAQASRRNIIIVDESKLTPQLGSHWALPLEVLPFAQPLIIEYVQALGARAALRRKENGEIVLTDQNNQIIDAQFGLIEDPARLGNLLSQRAGIVEHGLFLGLATDVVVAGKEGVRILQRMQR